MGALATLALLSAPAGAREVELRATDKVRTVEVRHYRNQWVHVYADGEELEQEFYSGCRARYRHPTLAILVGDCGGDLRITFVSLDGSRRFVVRLTRSEEG